MLFFNIKLTPKVSLF